MGDSRQEGSPLTGSGHDLSPPLGVVETVGVAPEGAQLIASGINADLWAFYSSANPEKMKCITVSTKNINQHNSFQH